MFFCPLVDTHQLTPWNDESIDTITFDLIFFKEKIFKKTQQVSCITVFGIPASSEIVEIIKLVSGWLLPLTYKQNRKAQTEMSRKQRSFTSPSISFTSKSGWIVFALVCLCNCTIRILMHLFEAIHLFHKKIKSGQLLNDCYPYCRILTTHQRASQL